ncbi:hypothetical protein, partial [Phaeodactylibacter sp.]|uniref:hypothetical protein n=1 Tax=Phaeodactylibacter sp. TaxID=1940289 RepID=UPI0025FA562C
RATPLLRSECKCKTLFPFPQATSLFFLIGESQVAAMIWRIRADLHYGLAGSEGFLVFDP